VGGRRPVGHVFVDLADAQTRLVEALGFPMYDQLDFYWDQDVHGAYELEQEMTKRFGSSPHPAPTRFAVSVHQDLLGRIRGPVPERIVRPELHGDVVTPPPPPSRRRSSSIPCSSQGIPAFRPGGNAILGPEARSAGDLCSSG
jgi:hypothetical protein